MQQDIDKLRALALLDDQAAFEELAGLMKRAGDARSCLKCEHRDEDGGYQEDPWSPATPFQVGCGLKRADEDAETFLELEDLADAIGGNDPLCHVLGTLCPDFEPDRVGSCSVCGTGIEAYSSEWGLWHNHMWVGRNPVCSRECLTDAQKRDEAEHKRMMEDLKPW